MTTYLFTKQYETPQQAARAARHYSWLALHAHPLRQPLLTAVGPTSLTYERIDGRAAEPQDLPRLAALLGDAHGAAWAGDLRTASLDVPHRFQDGTEFGDYLAPRRTALHRRRDQGYLPDDQALHTMLDVLEKTAGGPTAFYKDSNPRNFVITHEGTIYTVDVDDLTLAPRGYDLAKLMVALTFTHGPLPPLAVEEALDTYNQAAERHDPHLADTDRSRLDDFARLHAVLTAPYIWRNGYRHGQPFDNALSGGGVL